jgi:pimeloyl-ACP methyl ester carboxylesterase
MEKVDFISHGLRLQANFHTPEGPGPHPTLIVQHGFSGVKEMVDDFCAYFVRHGFACFAYDYPTLGESEGEPRSDSDPIAQIRSIRDAVSFLELRDDVDSDRIGFWLLGRPRHSDRRAREACEMRGQSGAARKRHGDDARVAVDRGGRTVARGAQ